MNKSLILSLLGSVFFFFSERLHAQCSPDLSPPIAVCDQNLEVGLDPGETETLLATVLDDGSWDNCSTILDFRIEELPLSATPPSATSLSYNASDLGLHFVALWVLDEAGNSNICVTEVNVIENCPGGSSTVLACNALVTVVIPAGGTFNFYPGDMLEGGPYCSTYQLQLNPPSTPENSLTFDETNFGTYVVQVTDVATGNACWGNIQVTSATPCTLPDVELPVPYCQNGLVIELIAGSPAVVEIFATDLDAGSYDNCTLPLDLEFRIEETTMPSATPPASETLVLTGLGWHELVVWVGDEAGNWDYCQTNVTVNNCTGNPTLACNDQNYVYVTPTTTATFYPDDILEGGPYCYDQMVLQLAPPSTTLPFLELSISDIGSYTVQVTNTVTGNSCWGTLNVEAIFSCDNDVEPPIAICDQDLVLELSQDGPDLTILQANALDGGSFDNCTLPQDLVFAAEPGPLASATLPATTFVEFTAVGTYSVVMWVVDSIGNTNTCVVSVDIVPPSCSPDVTNPVCVAPPNISISASEFAALNIDVQNPAEMDAQFGAPTLWDFCGIDTVLQTVSIVNNCGQIITRWFVAIDDAGNLSDPALQVIKITQNYTINIPKDFLPGDPSQEDLTVVATNGGTFGVAYEDLEFDYDCDNSADQIIRKWTVLNWCATVINQPGIEIPRLDVNNDGTAGDGYAAASGADSLYLLVSGVPTVGISLLDGIYTYTQIIRFNFTDTLVNAIAGSVFMDDNNDCAYQTGEPVLDNWTVKAVGQTTGNTYFANTNEFGLYEINGICPTDVILEVSLDVPFNYGLTCPTTWSVNLPTGMPAVQHIPVQLDEECPLMSVDIAAPIMKLCQPGYYYVNYCNLSADTIPGAFVEVALDSFQAFLGSGIPGDSIAPHTYSFQVGDLAPGECGTFWVNFFLDCDAPFGLTHCATAHIYPDTICPMLANWSGANLVVSGTCENDTLRLLIENTGTGSMAMPLEYIVVEDVIMYGSGSFDLAAGESQTMSMVPQPSATYTLQAPQETNHPYPGWLAVSVEGCGTGVAGGLVNIFPVGNPNPFISTFCLENVSSFDPNDKTGYPLGYGNEHFIERGQELDYVIRFQNTGTATAEKVVILDTLSSFLNAATVRPGASSHPFSFEMLEGNIIRLTFDPISLPDSNANEAASHGFVKFNVKQQPNLALGTVIENTAAIYFDFNEPVLTNTTFHTIGELHLEIVSDANERPNGFGDLHVFPNPASSVVNFEIPGPPVGDATFLLYDQLGRAVRSADFMDNRHRFERGALMTGIYFYVVSDKSGKLYSGKLIIQ